MSLKRCVGDSAWSVRLWFNTGPLSSEAQSLGLSACPLIIVACSNRELLSAFRCRTRMRRVDTKGTLIFVCNAEDERCILHEEEYSE